MFKHIIAISTAALLFGACTNNNLPENKVIAHYSCAPAADAEGTCSGTKSCTACKNCKYCKHCSKEGGTCGVCKN